jgi:NTE family protein
MALSAEEIRFLRETLPPSLLEKTLDGFRKDSPADPDYGLVLASLEITAEVLHVDSTVIYPSPRDLLDEVLLTIRQRMADRKLPLSDRIIFKNLDSSALKALSLATPKLAVANLFLTLLQKRMIGD